MTQPYPPDLLQTIVQFRHHSDTILTVIKLMNSLPLFLAHCATTKSGEATLLDAHRNGSYECERGCELYYLEGVIAQG